MITSRELQRRIEEVFDYAYTNSNIRIPSRTCKEVGKILHVGMYIEEVHKQRPAFQFSKAELKLLNGTLTAEVEDLATSIRKTYDEMNSDWQIYEDSNIEFSDKCIGFIVGKLEDIYISDPDRDVFGDTLEIFRSKWAKQEGGQFFTDQKVTSLAVEMLDYHPENGDDFVDTCAGTGGFLLAAFNKIKHIVDSMDGTEKEVLRLASGSLKGQEIDSDVASLGNSTIKARIGTYSGEIIKTGNSLDPKSYQDGSIREDTHLCLATNPPFGAKITIKDEQILRDYELARITNKNIATGNFSGANLYRRAPDILFVERNVKLLKPGKGRLAIVVPYQIVSGPQTLYVRDWILRNCRVIAAVDLPSETFQPHTGTKTALLVLERREAPLLSTSEIKEEKTFMSCPKWIGHDRRGNPVYKKNEDGSESDIVLSDFDDVESAFKAFNEGVDPAKFHKNSFVISSDEYIRDEFLRLNAQYHLGSVQNSGKSEFSQDDWEFQKMSSVVEKIFYPGRFKRNYVDKSSDSIPFFGGTNITQMIVSTDKWLRNDDPKLNQLGVKEGWLLITRSGTTGVISSVPKAWDGFAISEHVIRVVPNKEKLSPYYILAFLKTDYCQSQIAKGVFGSVIDEITPESIGNIEIPIPKDKQIYESICSRVERAEKAKQVSLDHFYGAVEELSTLFLD